MPFCSPWALDLSSSGIVSPCLFLLAYLDPGTGSYVLQLLLATLFGGLFALRQSWAGLKLWFSARFGDRSSAGDLASVRPGVGITPSSVVRVHGQPNTEID